MHTAELMSIIVVERPMIQKNMKVGTEREVRRRPRFERKNFTAKNLRVTLNNVLKFYIKTLFVYEHMLPMFQKNLSAFYDCQQKLLESAVIQYEYINVLYKFQTLR